MGSLAYPYSITQVVMKNGAYFNLIKIVSYVQAARQGSAKSSSYWSGKEENGSWFLYNTQVLSIIRP